MKELTVFEHDHVDVVDSRQVAEMVGKNHSAWWKSYGRFWRRFERRFYHVLSESQGRDAAHQGALFSLPAVRQILRG